MHRIVIYVEGIDRPGLLRDVTSNITGCGGNIIFNVAHGHRGRAYLLFIVDIKENVEIVKELIGKVYGVESVEVGYVGVESADIVAKYLEKDPAGASGLALNMHPEDFIMVLARLDDETRKKIYSVLPTKVLSLILAESPKELIDEIAKVVDPRLIAKALIELDPDDIVDVLQKLPSSTRKVVLKSLPKNVVSEIKPLLEYPPETAGGLMTTAVPKYLPSTPISKVIEDLSTHEYEISDTVYVVDKDGKLLGYVSVPSLFKASPSTPIGKLIRRDFIAVEPLTDQEEVARLMIKFDATRIPVVSSDGKLLGVVTIDDIADVLLTEESEDMLLFGGVLRVEHYLTTRVKDLFKKRFMWLLLLYLTENITARIVSSFSDMISKVAILAAFIPTILDTGGNAGSQSAVLITRALALGELTVKDVLRVLAKEFLTSMLLALTIAPIAFLFAYGVSFNIMVSIAVSLAVAFVVIASSVIGGLLPLFAVALKIDPAVISAPLLTTIADIIGLTIYFITVSMVLGII